MKKFELIKVIGQKKFDELRKIRPEQKNEDTWEAHILIDGPRGPEYMAQVLYGVEDGNFVPITYEYWLYGVWTPRRQF